MASRGKWGQFVFLATTSEANLYVARIGGDGRDPGHCHGMATCLFSALGLVLIYKLRGHSFTVSMTVVIVTIAVIAGAVIGIAVALLR